jgi:hypothetical protein
LSFCFLLLQPLGPAKQIEQLLDQVAFGVRLIGLVALLEVGEERRNSRLDVAEFLGSKRTPLRQKRNAVTYKIFTEQTALSHRTPLRRH